MKPFAVILVFALLTGCGKGPSKADLVKQYEFEKSVLEETEKRALKVEKLNNEATEMSSMLLALMLERIANERDEKRKHELQNKYTEEKSKHNRMKDEMNKQRTELKSIIESQSKILLDAENEVRNSR